MVDKKTKTSKEQKSKFGDIIDNMLCSKLKPKTKKQKVFECIICFVVLYWFTLSIYGMFTGNWLKFIGGLLFGAMFSGQLNNSDKLFKR